MAWGFLVVAAAGFVAYGYVRGFDSPHGPRSTLSRVFLVAAFALAALGVIGFVASIVIEAL